MARTPPARTVGQRPLIALVALVVLAIGATALTGELTARQDGGERAGPAPAAPASPSPEAGRTAEVVGPARGAEVAAYVEDRTAAMLDAPASVDTAVVSFTDVLSVQDAATVVGGAADVRAVLVRIPLEQASPRTVRVGPGDDPEATVRAVLAEQAQRLEAEELQPARELLASDTVEDEDFIAEYERRVAELEEALEAIEDTAVVHGVVLRAPVEELQDLVDATAVRLVDPAPPGTDVALSVFHGLLPSDTDTVSHGRAP